MTSTRDTIAAIATAAGAAGVGVVRVSGPGCAAIAQALLGRAPTPRHAHYLPFAEMTAKLANGVNGRSDKYKVVDK